MEDRQLLAIASELRFLAGTGAKVTPEQLNDLALRLMRIALKEPPVKAGIVLAFERKGHC